MRISAKIGLSFVLATVAATGCSSNPTVESDESTTDTVVQAQSTNAPSYSDLVGAAGYAKLVQGNDGVIIDASGKNVLIEVPGTPLEFQSEKDFVTYAAKKTFAKPVYGPKGELLGIAGGAQQYGQTVAIDHQAKTVAIVTDPIAAMLGGSAGYVKIAGKPLCLTESCAKAMGQLPPAQGSTPLSIRNQCAPGATPPFCLTEATWKFQTLNFHSAGASTLSVSDAWAAIICAIIGGTSCANALPDELVASARYVKNNGTVWGAHEARTARVYGVQVGRWALDFHFFKLGDGDLVDTSGVCGSHSGRRGMASVAANSTQEGNTRGMCN